MLTTALEESLLEENAANIFSSSVTEQESEGHLKRPIPRADAMAIDAHPFFFFPGCSPYPETVGKFKHEEPSEATFGGDSIHSKAGVKSAYSSSLVIRRDPVIWWVECLTNPPFSKRSNLIQVCVSGKAGDDDLRLFCYDHIEESTLCLSMSRTRVIILNHERHTVEYGHRLLAQASIVDHFDKLENGPCRRTTLRLGEISTVKIL